MLDENLLSEVSITGAAVIPGDDVPALKPTSSKNIDWRKPIHNGMHPMLILYHYSHIILQAL